MFIGSLSSASPSTSGLVGVSGFGGPSSLANGFGTGQSSSFSGSTLNFAAGLYNNLGQQIGVNQPTQAQAGGVAAERLAAERKATIAQSASLIDSGETEAGRGIAEKMLEKRGDDITALRLVALSYLAEQDYNQAERFFSRAAGLRPDDAQLRTDALNAKSLQRDDDEVLAEAKKKIENAGQRVEGLRLLLRLSDRSPDNADVYLALADGFEKARQPVQIIGALQEALSNSEGSAINEVISRAERLIADQPEIGIAHNILGRALLKSGKIDDAISRLRTATTVAPNNLAYRGDLANGFFARAEQFLEQGDVSSARGSLEAGRAIDPANSGGRPLEGRISARRGEKLLNAGLFEQALSHLNVAKLRGPTDSAFQEQLSSSFTRVARHFETDGSRALALSTYRKAFELDDKSAFAKRKVGELSNLEGLDALGNGNFDSAVGHLERAYDTQRGNDTYRKDLSTGLVARGVNFLGQGKLDEALDDFQRAFELDPTNSAANAQLSAALAQQAAS